MTIKSLPFLLSLLGFSTLFAADDWDMPGNERRGNSSPLTQARRLSETERALDVTMTELVSILGRKEELQGLKPSKPPIQREIKAIKKLLDDYNQNAFQQNFISQDLFKRASDLISSFERKEHLKDIFSLIEELHVAHLTKIEGN